MAPSSSANKVAKLAQKGKGKKVRFQGGIVFPAVIVGVLVLLIPLIVYARQSRPGPGEGEPTINQHWHAAYSMYVCDENGLLTLPIVSGALEEQGPLGDLISQKFQRTGIHSHNDGVIHWHPYSGAATGANAKLKVFLNNYDIKLSDDKLELPQAQGGQSYEEGKSKCVIDGVEKKSSLKLWVWNNYSEITTADPAVYTANMGNVRVDRDGMVFVVAFVPDDIDPVAPDYASRLPELGAADGSGPVTPDTTSTGDSVTPDGSVVVPGTAASTPGTGSTATTAVTTGSADTTTGSTSPSTATTGG